MSSGRGFILSGKGDAQISSGRGFILSSKGDAQMNSGRGFWYQIKVMRK